MVTVAVLRYTKAITVMWTMPDSTIAKLAKLVNKQNTIHGGELTTTQPN